MTRMEFIREAVNESLHRASGKYQYVKIPKEKYEKLNAAIKQMNMPFLNAVDFINGQIIKH